MRVSAAISSLFILLAVCCMANADILNGVTSTFSYDFSDGVSTGSAPTGSNPYVSASGYVAESNTEGSQGNSTPVDSGISGGRAYMQTHITGSSDGSNPPTTPIDPDGAYQTFSLTSLDPSNRYSLNSISFFLDSLGFDTPFITGTLKVEVQVSTDGFATSTVVGSGELVKTGAAPVPGKTVTIDSTTFGNLQEITAAQTDFRLVYTDTFNDNGVETNVDDVALSVTAIPEPGSIALLSLVCVSSLWIRRRR